MIFLFSLIAVIFLFLSLDLIENMDKFIDKHVPWHTTLLYYFYYIPNIFVTILPGVTMLAAVFSIGNLAKTNEIVAMKALGISLYQIIFILLGISFFICLGSFFVSEFVAAETNQQKENIVRTYLKPHLGSRTQLQNLKIQEPDGTIVTFFSYHLDKNIADQVKVERFHDGRLVERWDMPHMVWDGKQWSATEGYYRKFDNGQEAIEIIQGGREFHFNFSPEDFHIFLIKPEELGLLDLRKYVRRVKQAGGEVGKWETDYQMRFAFPLSNLFIVLLSVPFAYNRRRKSVAIGFIICLGLGFFYFGLMQAGQSLGHQGRLTPIVAAWLGNVLAMVFGLLNLVLTRK